MKLLTAQDAPGWDWENCLKRFFYICCLDTIRKQFTHMARFIFTKCELRCCWHLAAICCWCHRSQCKSWERCDHQCHWHREKICCRCQQYWWPAVLAPSTIKTGSAPWAANIFMNFLKKFEIGLRRKAGAHEKRWFMKKPEDKMSWHYPFQRRRGLRRQHKE